MRQIGQPTWVQRLIASYNPARYFQKFMLISLASMLLVLALANPRVQSSQNQAVKKGIDVMLALDVSKSMLAQDIKPSRLDRARQLLGWNPKYNLHEMMATAWKWELRLKEDENIFNTPNAGLN